MKKENTRALREGAMMVALTVILLLLTKYVPFFSIVGTFASSVPVAVLAARNNLKTVIVTTVSVLLVTFLIDGGIVAAISTVLMSVLPGAVAGYMLGRKKPFFLTVFGTALAVCLGWIFELAVIELLIGGIDEMFSQMTEMFKTTMDGVIKTLGSSLSSKTDMTPEEFVSTFANALGYTLRLYFPSMVVISSMITGYIIIRFSGFVMKRTKLASVEIAEFARLKAPRSVSTVAVILYLVNVFVDPQTLLWAISSNVVLILYTILGICGLSYIDYKFKDTVRSSALRFLIYGLVFLLGGALSGLVFSILIILGILDSSRDFRKIGNYSDT